eukprot:GHVL01023532.1.p1 GENE.GHVL01023532.1~~GHVL01023532.1.p1  ORF type:complete len:1163 (+),score=185.74 GHVL01023532.1:134-3622(+)
MNPSKAVRFSVNEKDEKDIKKQAYYYGKQIKELDNKWKLLPAFLEARGLVKQHINSFNHFVQVEMKQIVRAKTNYKIITELDPNFFIEYTDVKLGRPSYTENLQTSDITPHQCRLRDLTYGAPILVDVRYTRGNQLVQKNGVDIGRMPVMLKSCVCSLSGKNDRQLRKMKECPRDPGGYFVVRGTERVILMQEQMSKNRIIVEHDMKHEIQAVVVSATADNKSRTLVVTRHSKLYVQHTSFSELIPVCIVLKAMGLESDQEIVQTVGCCNRHHVEGITLCLQECHSANILSQYQALIYLGSRLRQSKRRTEQGKPQLKQQQQTDEALDSLNTLVLSHIELNGTDFSPKIRFLCLMIKRVLDAQQDKSRLDDKDYYGNKRLELAGQLISLLFEDLFKTFSEEVKKNAETLILKYQQSCATKQKTDILYPDCFHQPPTMRITLGFQKAISTGNWIIKRFKMERSGVAQVLNRLSYMATVGMMTRLTSQFEKTRKVAGPRALQPSQWGLVCPSDTPEGESCGLVKNLALMTHCTSDEDPLPLVRLSHNLGVEDAGCISGEELHSPGTYMVFLNGLVLGVHQRPQSFLNRVRALRRAGKVGEFVSVFVNTTNREIFIASDGGRLCRPLIIVENGVMLLKAEHLEMLARGEMTFMDFLHQGILEWVDVNEENNLLIAMRESDICLQTTHVEIDPLTIYGVVAGLVPYPHHNQSPRNTYQCAMGKQAMGAISFNQFIRTDTVLYLLVYPQRPLVTTKILDLVKWEQLPAGQNASVAVMSYSGYDIEDAIILNRASLDRGFGRCFVFRRQVVPMKRHQNGTSDKIFPPPLTDPKSGLSSGGRKGGSRKYEALDDDGLARIGEMVRPGQVYVNKHSPVNTVDMSGSKIPMRETPAVYRGLIPSFVDRILRTTDSEGVETYKIMMRQTRRPELGDKFSSRHGQKGVCGLIVPQEDMPFAEHGWCPDLIMNPHGFPSRMTVGKMIELIAGKSALIDGKFKYGTIFGGTKVEEISHILMAHGFSYSGKEYITSGVSGEPLQSYIFCGPVYYQKLKHMVLDKIHARSRGPRAILTRQPTEGRSRDGGLRLGEMERDCLVAYGASNLLIERLMLSSDAFEVGVCRTCGLMGYNDYCPSCDVHANLANIRLPYACKLLMQELQSMNICPRIRLTDL